MDFAKDGDLSRYDPEEIADGAMWEGDAQKFLDSLIQAGFVDRDETGIYLHDWDEYAGRLIRANSRKKDLRRAYENGTIAAVKQRDGDRCRYCGTVVDWKDKKGPTGGTYDHIDPNGPSTEENLVVCCRSCSSKKAGRKPEEAGMRLLPVPDPNQIRIKSAPNQDQIRNESESNAGQVELNTQQNDTSVREEKRTPEDEAPETVDDDLAAVIREYEACGYGMIHERVLDHLSDLLDNYGREWVVNALHEGMRQGKRTLAYVNGILQRWQSRGGMTTGPSEPVQDREKKARERPGSSKRKADDYGFWNDLSL